MSEPGANPEATSIRPGELLRQAREQRGLTPVQAAHEMRIDLATLRALEGDDYARLGAPIFVKGHLRNYAKHLGIAAEPLVEAYELTAAPRPPSLVGYRNEGEQMGGHLELRRMLPAVAATVGAVLLALFALWFYRRPAAPPAPVEVAAAPPTVVAAATTTLPSATPVTLAAPTDALSKAPADAIPKTAPAATPVSAPTAAVPAEARNATPSGQVRLQFKFSAESWVEVYDANNAPLVYQLFEAGQTRELNATPPLRVFLGQAASAALAIDGKKVDLVALTKRDATARFGVAAGGAVR